ncbi:MAG: T9SS type A sorting domain-containing protein [Chitinophagales bacterium]
MLRIVIALSLLVCCFLPAKAQLFTTDPAPYCADTISNADSSYLAAADFGAGFVIPALSGTPYINGTGLFYSVVRGVNAQVQVGVANYAGQTLAVWVDVNRDTVFSDDEKFYEQVNVIPGALLNVSFHVPDTAQTGTTRARIRIAVSDSSIIPCGDFSAGSTIDFSLLINETAAPYCEPVSFAGCSDYDYIDSLVLNTVTYTWPGPQSPGYQFINQTTTLQAGQSYQLVLRNGNSYASAYNAWIDYNNNHVFDANELLNTDLNLGLDSLVTISFTVPANATVGQTRFRIRGNADNASTGFGPCDTLQYGMVLEFNVGLLPVGISENQNTPINVYPNPATGSVTVDVTDYANAELRITNAQGALITEGRVLSSVITIPLPQAGIYFVSVYSQNKLMGTKKIVSLK